MLFSVVIPTRNRLHLLRDAIETIRLQASTSWEIVVFDNYSTDPVEEHIRSLNDDRIRYHRSEKFLPVSDSWNCAIDLARGDYVILLGDDDGLTPDYFGRLHAIVEKFKGPDLVYTNFYQFWFPGVAPWRPAAHVLDVRHGFFFVDRDEPFLLSREDAKRAAIGSLQLRINFSFNSQAFIYSRPFLDRLRVDGQIYQSPFPDYYIANVAMVRSSSTVVVPEPLAIAGVSKASYGYTLYNDQEQRGEALLNVNIGHDPIYQELKPTILAGPAYNTNFVVSMEYVARSTREDLGESVAFKRYRRLQISSALHGRYSGTPAGAVWPVVQQNLTLGEHAWATALRYSLGRGKHHRIVKQQLAPWLERMTNMTGFGPMPRYFSREDFLRVTDVYDALEKGTLN
jgi:glycosyltransferase involved in cell wall biosynthesis